MSGRQASACKSRKRKHVSAFFGACAAAAVVHAAAADQPPADSNASLAQALANGSLIFDVRTRIESKDQDGFAEEARASTVRARIGYESGAFHGWRFLVEAEGVGALGDDRFNSTTNGRTAFPVVADPDAFELNRAQLSFAGIDRTTAIFGRQRINIGNQRFVGAVGFRQNEQTYDAVRVTTELTDGLNLDYAYIARVHRIFGDDSPVGEFDSDTHALAATYDSGAYGKITGYAFLVDLDEAPALSSATWGARYENSIPVAEEAGFILAVVGELATQSDYGGNAIDYREGYVLAEAALKARSFTATLGYERLGGDGEIGFSTPLATLHKFQGFADVFLTTPAAGLEDVYAGASQRWSDVALGPITIFATHHEFKSARGSLNYGRETDVGGSIVFSTRWSADVKAAFYDGGDDGFADRDLFWASLQYRY